VSIQAIQAMLAPVVLTSTAAIVAGGILTMYAAVNDRMRAMTAEGLSRLTDDRGELAAASARPSAAQERLRLIDAQLPRLVRRHRRLHNALFLIYTAILFVVVGTRNQVSHRRALRYKPNPTPLQARGPTSPSPSSFVSLRR
jgi:hypothetical protein